MKYFLYCRKSTEAEDRQVMSLESQRLELERGFLQRDDVEIVAIITEAKSAKSPGRPLFNDMVARIEAGEAHGILAWAPDRLARNSIDGGRLVYLLDTGVLKDLKFATYTFENNSQGKFMLAIMFGQSKYYSDALSENVKRGNRTKAALGWRPGAAPAGYLNDPATKTILPDPVYFPIIRRMFDLVLIDGLSAREVAKVAREQWRLQSPKRRRGGGIIHESLVHRILTNPFYAGDFVWEGELVRGQHPAVVTLNEFERVQTHIRRPVQRRPIKRSFALSGLIKCGECGRTVTPQISTNRFGTTYTYYQCGRRKPCSQKATREEALLEQIGVWLAERCLDASTEASLRKTIDGLKERGAATATAIRKNLERGVTEVRAQLSELTQLRLRRLVDDEEFLNRRTALQAELEGLTRRLSEPTAGSPDEMFKPLEAAISFSNYAVDWFRNADNALKAKIVRLACSNLTLMDKKLSIEAAKWSQALSGLAPCPNGLGLRDEVQTLEDAFGSDTALAKSMMDLCEDAEALAQSRHAGEVVAEMKITASRVGSVGKSPKS
ncbi:MAG: recombinase family protein [Caulobacter sp.]